MKYRLHLGIVLVICFGWKMSAFAEETEVDQDEPISTAQNTPQAKEETNEPIKDSDSVDNNSQSGPKDREDFVHDAGANEEVEQEEQESASEKLPPAGPVEEQEAGDEKELPRRTEDAPALKDSGTLNEDQEYVTIVVAKRKTEGLFTSERSVGLVDKKKLEEMAPRSTPEALWDSPGVFVQQTNHGGGSPIMRGSIGPQNLILVDGVRLNNSVYRTGPVQYLNLIDPLSVQQIEILRGPGSVLYGSDAMGGVIQIMPLTATITGKNQMSVQGAASGTFTTANRGLGLHTHNELSYNNFGFLAGVSYKDFNNLTGGTGVGEQVYSGYTDVSAVASAEYHFDSRLLEGWNIKGAYLFSRIEDAGRTDKLVDSNSLQMYDNDDGLVYARMHGVFKPIQTSFDLTLSFQHFYEKKDNHKTADDLFTILSTNQDTTLVYTLGTDLQATSSLLEERLRLQYGGMFYRDWVDTSQKNRQAGEDWEDSNIATFPAGSSYDNYGVFALIEGDPISTRSQHILRLSGGVRLHGMQGKAPARLDLPQSDFDFLGFVFLGGIQYLFQQNATVAVTFSQGFRAPNLNEAVMLGDTGKYFHIPNDSLKPERSDTFELLTRLRFGRFTLGASGYISLLQDLIKREESTWQGQTTIDDKPVAKNVNGNEGILLGLESQLGVDLGAGFHFNAHLTYTYGKEMMSDGSEAPLTRIPPLYGYFNLRYDMPAITFWKGFVETYFRFADKQTRLSAEDESDVRIPEGGTPGWWTWNVAMGYTGWERIHLLVRAENLLNQKYKYHGSGIFSPGTNVSLSLRLVY